jgi:hypothetical protein
MATKSKPARVIQFAYIQQEFKLAPLALFGTVHPAVAYKDGEGYSIRVAVSHSRNHLGDVTEKFDYFYLDAEGTITEAPRGYAKDYRPGRIPVEELDAAVARYAEAVR